jgi:hypothetical protein
MKKAPNIWALRDFFAFAQHNYTQTVRGTWTHARPIGLFSLRHRLRCAWWAFTGHCDLILWPEDEHPEDFC